jgi:hypothetical protein
LMVSISNITHRKTASYGRVATKSWLSRPLK